MNQTLDLAYIFQLAKAYKRELVFANVIAILAAVLAVPIPLILPLMVDEVLLNKPGTTIEFFNLVMPLSWQGAIGYIMMALFLSVFIRFLSILLTVLEIRFFSIISKSITYSIRERLLKHLNLVSLSEYEALGSGGLASHFITDIEVIDSFISVTLSRVIVSILSIVGTAIILLAIHWQLALIILFFNPLVILFTITMGKKVKRLKQKENSAVEIFQQALIETLDAIHQIRAANREKHYVQRILEFAGKVKQHSIEYTWKTDVATRFSNVIFLIGFDIFRAISMLMVLFSDLSIGLMFAVFGYLWFMMAPVTDVLNIQYAWYGTKAALNRINQIFALKVEPDNPHGKDPFSSQSSTDIKIQKLCFNYANTKNATILEDFSMHIAQGQTIALVGASGSGKSTLINAILQLYPIQGGDILFNQVSRSEISPATIRENISVVMQAPVIFNDTVRENLCFGKKHSDEELWEALEIAQLKSTIKELPEQLDSILGRQGIRLSGGQRQRLAIARMILTNPKVVIFDEATSALDTETEKNLHEALQDFLADKTTLIIAHRLSAIQYADEIVVLEKGRIIAQGIHQQLMEQCPYYFRLYGEQAKAALI